MASAHVDAEAPGSPQKAKQADPEPNVEATIKAIVDAYLADAQGRVKANTYANYRLLLKAVSKAHGHLAAEAFTLAKSLAFVKRRGGGKLIVVPIWGR